MNENKQSNIKKSIVLIGPSGVGKSLIASRLSQKTNLPILDIDDLLFIIEAEVFGDLSRDEYKQEKFIATQVEELNGLEREIPLTEKEKLREKELVCEFIDLYNYYSDLLGGFNQFYDIYYDYYKATQKCKTMHGELCSLNKATLKILDRVFDCTNTPLIISPSASFGWNTKNPLHANMYKTQKEVGKFLDSTQTVFLQPGEDYYIRNDTQEGSVNDRLLLKHTENYYNNADIEVCTNGLFNEPENDFLKQRTWFNVRETLTKERLLNKGELDSVCEQILGCCEENMLNMCIADDLTQ